MTSKEVEAVALFELRSMGLTAEAIAHIVKRYPWMGYHKVANSFEQTSQSQRDYAISYWNEQARRHHDD